MIYRDPSRCELKFDRHDKTNKPCRGKVKRVGGIRLCKRHRDLVAAIARDANQEGRRHPIHRGRAA